METSLGNLSKLPLQSCTNGILSPLTFTTLLSSNQ